MYGKLEALDREVHANLKLDPVKSVAPRVAGMNSIFITAIEFQDACREFPIVFVRAGEPVNGRQEIAPLAVLGLKPGSNLFVKGDEWTGNYVPAYVRRYPFAMARIEGAGDNLAICFDREWGAFSNEAGEALFANGEPTEFLLNAKKFLEHFEQETERTRLVCQKLAELDLFTDMRFEASLPDGEKLDVEGFLALNEEKYHALTDAQVLELHRLGLIALIEMHRVSMGNMNRLANRYIAPPAA